ncbi:glutamate racemase [Prochlorococcus sp. MIT 1307]|uniref:glutamate racemase n=1 Tax=Prochlorococcus sp. MIT 1307 TaxID=3096219 RepID=UPI002A765FBA|nr:glutamate racemase [Prochlorococcus sp. MIT 1307]
MIARLGLFDSGIGGFTVLNKVVERHGDVHCLYLGDTARVPYGEKQASEIRLIAKEIAHWFLCEDVSAILVACNTTNSLAFDVVQKVANIPIIGLINAAAELITESKVGVLATSATASSNAYKNQIEAFRPGTIVFEQACPAFVPLIEAGQMCSNSINRFAVEYLTPLLDAGVEVVVLGCSHYPLLQPFLQEIIPKHIRLVDPAIGLAQKLDRLLGTPKTTLQSPFSISNTRFCVTSNPIDFAAKAAHLLGVCPEVDLVSLRPKACFF